MSGYLASQCDSLPVISWVGPHGRAIEAELEHVIGSEMEIEDYDESEFHE